MEPEKSDTPQKPAKGYGKRPMWQWVVIYVIVAAIVYGIIYYAFVRKTGGSGLNY